MSKNQKNVAFERSRLPQSTRRFSKITFFIENGSKMDHKRVPKWSQNPSKMFKRSQRGVKIAIGWMWDGFQMDFGWLLDAFWMKCRWYFGYFEITLGWSLDKKFENDQWNAAHLFCFYMKKMFTVFPCFTLRNWRSVISFNWKNDQWNCGAFFLILYQKLSTVFLCFTLWIWRSVISFNWKNDQWNAAHLFCFYI